MQRKLSINRHLLLGAPNSDVFVVQILVRDPVSHEVLDGLFDGLNVSEEVILHVFSPTT